MEQMMRIGADLSEQTATNAADAVSKVLKAAYKTRASDEVVLRALDTLKGAITVQNVAVNGCTFDNSKSVVVPEDFSRD
ncbi:MAG: hypothetical protein ACRDC4_17440 [Plesiomonas sp.]